MSGSSEETGGDVRRKINAGVQFIGMFVVGLLSIVFVPTVGMVIIRHSHLLGWLDWLGMLIGALLIVPVVFVVLGGMAATNPASAEEVAEEGGNPWVSRTRRYIGWSIWNK